MPSVTTQIMMEEALSRGWQASLLDDKAPFIVVTLPDGSRHYVYGTVIDASSATGLLVNRHKLATYLIAEQLDIPVARYAMYDPAWLEDVEAFARQEFEAGRQLVMKPINTDHGQGVSVGISSLEALHEAYAHALQYSNKIIVQRRHYGDDCRVTVVDGRFVAAARRVPASVTGDGVRSVAQLIEDENDRRSRIEGRTILRRIHPDVAERFLGPDGFNAVPEAGERLFVSGAANFGRGGEVEDITDDLHQSYKDAAIRLSDSLGLKVCGADFLCRDITLPMDPETAILLEINCAIGLRLHHYPNRGKPRNVAGAVLDALERSTAATGTERTDDGIR